MHSFANATLILLLLSGCASAAPRPSAASTSLGKPVSFDLPTNRGDLISVPVPGARATVVDAWGPTCIPCQKSLPELMSKKAELEAADAKLVLVAVLADGETTEQAEATLHSWGVDAPFLVDHAGRVRAEAGFSGLPATLVLDRQGVLQWLAPPGASAEDVVHVLTTVQP